MRGSGKRGGPLSPPPPSFRLRGALGGRGPRGCTCGGEKRTPLPLGFSPTNRGMEGEGGVGLARFWCFEWRTPFPMMLCFFLFNLGGGGCSTRTGARGASSWSTPWARALRAFNRALGERVRHAGRGPGVRRARVDGVGGFAFSLPFEEVAVAARRARCIPDDRLIQER